MFSCFSMPKPSSLRRRSRRLAAAGAAVALTAGCAVGPTYHRPPAAVPVDFKEAGGWTAAAPNDAAPKGPWWEIFQDPILNDLETRATAANLTIVQAAANYEQARQVARAERATLLPPIAAEGSADRSRLSAASRGLNGSAVGNTYTAMLSTSWEPDFWGQVRRQIEADVAAAQADAANLANARLSIQSELAQDYVALRVADEKARLLEDAVKAYERTLVITRNKYAVGVAARGDILVAEAQLDATRAQAIDAGVQRAQLEHAIAVFLGRAPAEFSLAPEPGFKLTAPSIPRQMPSTLLQRRPDIAGAERAVAEANAKVGVQVAAYFPSLSLTGGAGYESAAWHQLFVTPNRVWDLAADLSGTLFDWGQRRAELLQARAAYDASVGNYRATVLGAFQQVEDDLAALRILAEELKVLDTTVSEAAQATQIAINEYTEGTIDYTTVVTAQAAELADRESALAAEGSRLAYEVELITALGGGWESADLPTAREVVKRRSPEAVAAPR
jgi:NodT family efflux transporter outer membrane factor (OMF) lipoprotein